MNSSLLIALRDAFALLDEKLELVKEEIGVLILESSGCKLPILFPEQEQKQQL